MINQKESLSAKEDNQSVEKIKHELNELKKETIKKLKEILDEIENMD